MAKPRNETPEQRQARTAKARATLAARFSSPEEKAEFYRKIVQKRWANHREQSGAGTDEHDPAASPRHLAG